MATASDVGRAFYEGRRLSGGTHGNIKSVPHGNKVLLVGYDWAVYGIMDKTTGKVTYFSGWKGNSRTTSKHLSQTGISYKHDFVDNSKPTMNDIN